MNDLEKLMKKMDGNKSKVAKAKPVAEPVAKPEEKVVEDLEKDIKKLETKEVTPEEVKEAVVDAPVELDDDEDEEDAVEQSEPIPATEDNPDHTVEAEVGLLQNNGMFRRELILAKKEQNDILKVIAQTLLDIKKKLTGEEDAQS